VPKQITNIVHEQDDRLDLKQLEQMQRDLFGQHSDADKRFRIWLGTHLRTRANNVVNLAHQLSVGQVKKVRDRFRRELELRQTDDAYRSVSLAAELLDRPLKADGRRTRVDLAKESLRLKACLDRLFGREAHERHNIRLSQLTGLDDRHTLDLIKGANGIGQVWWDFLESVEAVVLPVDDLPLLRRMGSHQAAGTQFTLDH
jgi:hypothetical protein